MAILDVPKYEGPNDVLVWKWRSESNDSRENELRMGSQLIVNESQEACFYKGGQLLDVLGPGTHTLSTKNLPILSKRVIFSREILTRTNCTMNSQWFGKINANRSL